MSSTPITSEPSRCSPTSCATPETVDFAREAIAPLTAYLDEAADILLTGRLARGRRRRLVRGAIRHALDFSTWRSPTANGIGRSGAAALATALVDAAAAARRINLI